MGMIKSKVGRAAAILTTSEVAATAFAIMAEAAESEILLDLRFTLGSLTNVIVRFYGLDPEDGTTWVPIQDAGGNVSYTLTASTDRLFHIRAPGVNSIRASVQGTGTVTSSSAKITYRYRGKGAR